MAASSRLANLPGYDTAPDIYETPSLTSDNTSLPTSPLSRTSSISSSRSSNPEDGISHRRLLPSAARERFAKQSKSIDVKAGDFSDRVGGAGGRKGYRVRRRSGGEEESWEQRVSRLRREVEECRVQAAGQGESAEEGVEGLRRVLDGLEGRHIRARGQAGAEHESDGEAEEDEGEEATAGRVAQFDARLAALERTLGPLGVDVPGDAAAMAPVMPSLQLLDQQLSALMAANSLDSLEATSGRIRKLRDEAEALSTTTAPTTNGTDTTHTSVTSLSPTDITQLQSLHTLLPVLQSLTPTVPALLDRLRSLRTLHSGAANAAADLEALERREEEFDAELKDWREGLERVESAVKEADETNGRNGKVVQGWVGELQGRIGKLR
jgi:nuclear migration protein JNM1